MGVQPTLYKKKKKERKRKKKEKNKNKVCCCFLPFGFAFFFLFLSPGLKSSRGYCDIEFFLCVYVYVCSSLVRFSLFGSPLKSPITTKL